MNAAGLQSIRGHPPDARCFVVVLLCVSVVDTQYLMGK